MRSGFCSEAVVADARDTPKISEPSKTSSLTPGFRHEPRTFVNAEINAEISVELNTEPKTKLKFFPNIAETWVRSFMNTIAPVLN